MPTIQIKVVKKYRRAGFTLIELLVVVAIMALLAVLVVTQVGNARSRAHDVVSKSDLVVLRNAVEAYNVQNSKYPDTFTNNPKSYYWVAEAGFFAIPTQLGGPQNWIPGIVPNYIAELPHDPNSGQANTFLGGPCADIPGYSYYLYESDGRNYKILSHCLPRTSINLNDPFYDPVRGYGSIANTGGFIPWAYQVSTAAVTNAW